MKTKWKTRIQYETLTDKVGLYWSEHGPAATVKHFKISYQKALMLFRSFNRLAEGTAHFEKVNLHLTPDDMVRVSRGHPTTSVKILRHSKRLAQKTHWADFKAGLSTHTCSTCHRTFKSVAHFNKHAIEGCKAHEQS